MKRAVIGVLLACTLSCPVSYGQADINEAARVAYQREKETASQRGDLITGGADYDRIQLITRKLIAVAPEMRTDTGGWAWDVAYIRSAQVNAHCLPGGKIVVFSGLVERPSLNDDELAAVIGHEMGHALLEHGRESHTERQVAKVAVGILGIVAAIIGAKHHQDPNVVFNASTTVGAVGAEFFALRPYSRERELVADAYGAELAARAGFDPRGAVSLQQKLSTQGVIEFLSTHPASETRVQQLAQIVPATAERFASRRNQQDGISVASTPPPAAKPAVVAVGDANSRTISLLATKAPQTDGLQAKMGTNAVAPPSSATREGVSEAEVITGAAAASMTSKYMFSAERYVKGRACQFPVATMSARAPTYESFSIKCSGGAQLLVRCDDGDCKTQD